MKCLSALYSLSICMLLSNPVKPTNDSPCQPSKYNNAHDTFLHRHLPKGAPSGLNKTVWERFLRGRGDCSRPTQSFLPQWNQARVDTICSSSGGKHFRRNLCISIARFSFVTVRSVENTCRVLNVQRETKHLILACNALDNRCLPVHFEGNPDDLSPAEKDGPCGGAAGHALTTLQLLGVLAVSFTIFDR